MKKLIVNADDYGHTPGVAEGIRRAHLHGIVTSTSAMMNRPHAEAALRQALVECPRLGIGLHLVLTTGVPVLPADKIPTLTRPDGSFFKQEGFVQNLSRVDLDQVSTEWHAQAERFVAITGCEPDHLDSHHHSSYFTPALFERMLRLAEELHCPIRKPFGDDSADAADYLPGELADQASQGYLNVPGHHRPRTTEGFIGDFYDEGATLEHLLRLIEMVKNDPKRDTFELMCHPAVVDDTLKQVSSYNTNRASELEVLLNDAVKAAISEAGIALINYTQL